MPRNEPKIYGVPWFKLPLRIRETWWKETDYNRKPPTPEFLEALAVLLITWKISTLGIDPDRENLADYDPKNAIEYEITE